ncbi:antibiotic biosynthesis monooxygenase [soil metagenome]
MTTIDPDHNVMTLINVFRVDPSRCDELVANLITATTDTLADMPGFVSANIHRSDDGTTVVNYAQWTSREDYRAALDNPAVLPHLRQAADIAESFDPIIATVVHSTSRS